MGKTSEMMAEAVSALSASGTAVSTASSLASGTVAVVETPINPMIGIDSSLSLAVMILAFTYIAFLCFFPTKRRAQMWICLGLAAISFFRIGLGVEIFMPIFLGCLWLFNATMSFHGMKTSARIQARIAELQLRIDRTQAEINRVENRTYTVWPPNPE